METPLSTRRVTRSQTVASEIKSDLKSRKVEESEMSAAKSLQTSGKKQHQDRSALIDITNDSPIVGVAMGNLETPSSAMSKKGTSTRGRFIATPNSGEALLRGQVKNLLQKVEEEAEFSKICVENRPFFNHLQGLTANSPMISLIAPTPANTPQVLNFSGNVNINMFPPSAEPADDKFLIPQMISETESENAVTRSLLLDFSEKSESSECSSVLTCIGQLCDDTDSSVEKSTDDDDASIWSIQANAGSTREDDEEEEEEESDGGLEEEEEEDYYEDEMEDYGVDEVCEGMSKISVKGPSKLFAGKHIRFVYNSDEELVEGDLPAVGRV